MHFQLLFPGKNSNAGACLRGVGLNDFVEGSQESPIREHDVSGLLVGWGPKIGYEPANQRWIDSGEGYLIGFWNDSPCTPKDLARVSMFSGYSCTLSDGQEWQIPCARMLPSSFRLVGSHWSSVRKPQFNDFWERSEIWFRRFELMDMHEPTIISQDGITAEQLLDQWCEFCCFAIRQNYRLTPRIASELGLLDSTSKVTILMAAIEGMPIKEVVNELSELHERAVATGKKEDAPVTTGS